MRAARVFISCGQRNDRELRIGHAVVEYFHRRGFETFFAAEAHSAEGLTEHIFRSLRESEYFVFVDFKRESLSESEFRGSLFVSQELAIATFLGRTGVGFTERGIRLEGVSEFQILNATPFDDSAEILDGLDRDTQSWDPDSVQELALLHDPRTILANLIITDEPNQPQSDWYHLQVLNRHRNKHALDCLGYLTKIQRVGSQKEYSIPSNELTWAGIGDVRANIIAGSSRDLDAFFVVAGIDRVRFHQRPTSTNIPRYNLPELEPGSYELEYTVLASNFPTVTQRFRLEFKGRSAVRFETYV